MSRSYISDKDCRKFAEEYFYPGGPTETDYLAYLIDECELNTWCKSAFPGMLRWTRGGGTLSPKQLISVVRAIHEFGVFEEDVKEGFLYRGWASRTDSEVLNNKGPGTVQSTKMAAAGDVEKEVLPWNAEAKKNDAAFHDMDDDIPF
jgi:hypothetical protein